MQNYPQPPPPGSEREDPGVSSSRKEPWGFHRAPPVLHPPAVGRARRLRPALRSPGPRRSCSCDPRVLARGRDRKIALPASHRAKACSGLPPQRRRALQGRAPRRGRAPRVAAARWAPALGEKAANRTFPGMGSASTPSR